MGASLGHTFPIWRSSVKVGDLAMLANWCKNGPCLMHIVKTGYDIQAMYMQGPKSGTTCQVNPSNLFALDKYDDAMKEHYESR